MSASHTPFHSVTCLHAPIEQQSSARLRSAVVEGWVASRYETLPGRAQALRLWVEQLLAPHPQATLFSATIGSAASDILAALNRVHRIQPHAAIHSQHGSRPTSLCRSRLMHPAAFAPSLASSWSSLTDDEDFSSRDPRADQCTIENSHRLVVLWLRRSSQLARRLLGALEKHPRRPTILIPDDDRLVAPCWRRRLVKLQAQLVSLPTATLETDLSAIQNPCQASSQETPNTSRSSPLQILAPTSWLIHTTRASDRRRAGESRIDFFSRLFALPREQIGGPFVTLRTILQQALLRGRSEPIRGNVRVVSWSATPLQHLLGNRTFRRGRRHWDYEPYGIAIPRDLAPLIAASPVIYGPEAHYAQLPPEQQPFFQPVSFSSPASQRSSGKIDWTFEREWRSIGDVRLVGAIAKQAIAFVPTHSEATELQSLSPLPVIALESPQAQSLLQSDSA